MRVSALSTVALSIYICSKPAIFLHRLQSSLFHLITVELGWHVHEDKAVFFPSSAAVTKELDRELYSQSHLQMSFEGRALNVTSKLTPRLLTFSLSLIRPVFLLLFCQVHGTFIGKT